MSVRVAGVLAVVLCGVAVGPVAAQGLADVARREADRRDQIKTPGKVLTNADLPPSAVVGPAPAAGAAAAGDESAADATAKDAATPPAAGTPGSAPTAAPDDEDGWKKRAAAVNTALTEARAQVRQLQALVDRLGLEMAATDKTIAARAEVERAQVRAQLGEAEARAAAAAAARQALEQEATASGVPSAWIQ